MSIQTKLLKSLIKKINPETVSKKIIEQLKEKVFFAGTENEVYIRVQRAFDVGKKEAIDDVVVTVRGGAESRVIETCSIEKFVEKNISSFAAGLPISTNAMMDLLGRAIEAVKEMHFPDHLRYVIIGMDDSGEHEESPVLSAIWMQVTPNGTDPETGAPLFIVEQEGPAINIEANLPNAISSLLQWADSRPGGIMGLLESSGVLPGEGA